MARAFSGSITYARLLHVTAAVGIMPSQEDILAELKEL